MTGVSCGSPAVFFSKLLTSSDHRHVFQDGGGLLGRKRQWDYQSSSTSTRVPGTTKPATPMTSFTRTEIARIPGGMSDGMPEPAFSPASLLGRKNSPLAIGKHGAAADNRRLQVEAIRRADRQRESGPAFTSRSSTLAPTGMSLAAITTSTPGGVSPPVPDFRVR